MKKVILGLVTILSILFFVSNANAQSREQSAVKEVIDDYFKALNASDANTIASLFTPEGVLLASGAPTATGSVQVNGTFQYVFDNFTYTLKVSIGEITIDGNHAYVSSTSKGSFLIKSNQQKVDDDFRETFILKKLNGKWRIARYMYNKSK